MKAITTLPGLQTYAFKPGQDLFVRGLIGFIPEELVKIVGLSEGNKITFKSKTTLVLEGAKRGAFSSAVHVRFGRPHEEGEQTYCHPSMYYSPKMANILLNKGLKPMRIIGGLKYALAKKGEIFIPAFKNEGTSFWVLSQEEIDQILEANPLSHSTKVELQKRVQVLRDRLDEYFSDSNIISKAGEMLWDDKSISNPSSKKHAWTVLTVVRDGKAFSLGFNAMLEDINGDISYFSHSRGRDIRYHSLPETLGGRHLFNTCSKRWLNPFNYSTDQFRPFLKDFDSVEVECYGFDLLPFAKRTLTREDVLSYMEKAYSYKDDFCTLQKLQNALSRG